MKKKNNNIISKAFIFGFIMTIPAIITKMFFKLSEIKYKDKDDENDGFIYKSNIGDIYYNIKGVGEPILLIHSVNYIGASMKEWEQNIDELSYNYKVYTLDLPGFGKSEKPKTTFTAYNYAIIINKFIKDIIKKPCSIIASNTSCGFVLMSDRIENGNIKKIININPTGINYNDIAINSDTKKLKCYEIPYIGNIRYALKTTKKTISNILENKVFFNKENITEDFKNNCIFNARKNGTNSKFSYASYESKFMNIDIKLSFKHSKTPIYFIWGEENIDNDVSNLNILKEINPNIEFTIFKNTKMLPHYENNIEFNKIVENFFEK